MEGVGGDRKGLDREGGGAGDKKGLEMDRKEGGGGLKRVRVYRKV